MHKIETVSVNQQYYPASTFYKKLQLPQLLIKYAQYEIPATGNDNDPPTQKQLNAGLLSIKRRVNNFYELHPVLRVTPIPCKPDPTGLIGYSHIMPTVAGITLTRALAQTNSHHEQYTMIIAALVALHQYHQRFNKVHLDPSSHNIMIDKIDDAPPQAALIDLDHATPIGSAIQGIDADQTRFSYWPQAFIHQATVGQVSAYHDLYMFVLFLCFEEPFNYLGHAHYSITTRIRLIPTLLDALTHRTPLDALIRQLNQVKNNPPTNSIYLPRTYPRIIAQLYQLADQSHHFILLLLDHPPHPSLHQQRRIENTIKTPVELLTQRFVSMAYDPLFEGQTAFDQLLLQCTATNHCLQALLKLPQITLSKCLEISLLTSVMHTDLHRLVYNKSYYPHTPDALLLTSITIFNRCPDIINSWMTQTTLNNWLIRYLVSNQTHNTQIAHHLTVRQIKGYLRYLGLYIKQLNLASLKQECRQWLANQPTTGRNPPVSLFAKRKNSRTITTVSTRQSKKRAPKQNKTDRNHHP